MTNLVVPLEPHPYQIKEVRLDNETFYLVITYNARIDLYTMLVQDAAGNDLVGSIPLVKNYSLLSAYTNQSLPQGRMCVIEVKKMTQDPAFDDLGVAALLCYEGVT